MTQNPSDLHKKSLILLFAVLIAVSGVASGLFTNFTQERSSLLSSPLTLEIEGRNFTLAAFFWRDFMPGNPDSSLICVIKIIPQDDLAFPNGSVSDRMWAINGEFIWETAFTYENRPVHDNHYENVARFGPLWETTNSILVIVRIIYNGRIYYLRAENQELIFTS